MIDRVDQTRFGHLEVTDYKTGKSDPYTKLTAEAPDDNGVHLQLPIYALAARAAFADHDGSTIQSSYRFINKNAGKREIGYVVDDDVLALFSADVEIIVDGIEQGLFPARPLATTRQGFTPCQYCDPDGMGVVELAREWDRKQTADVLAAYRRLLGAEAGDDDASDGESDV
jgi:hypothetical protein